MAHCYARLSDLWGLKSDFYTGSDLFHKTSCTNGLTALTWKPWSSSTKLKKRTSDARRAFKRSDENFKLVCTDPNTGTKKEIKQTTTKKIKVDDRDSSEDERVGSTGVKGQIRGLQTLKCWKKRRWTWHRSITVRNSQIYRNIIQKITDRYAAWHYNINKLKSWYSNQSAGLVLHLTLHTVSNLHTFS